MILNHCNDLSLLNSNLNKKLDATSQGHVAIEDSLSSNNGSNTIYLTWSTSGTIQFRVDGILVKEI